MPDTTVSQHDLASWLDLSTRRIRELTASQVLTKGTKGYPLKPSVLAYLKFLRSKTGSLTNERARLTKLQGDIVELKLREKTGGLVLREAVEREVFRLFRQARNAMQNIPPRVSGIVAAETDQGNVFAMLTQEIQQALEGLSHGLQAYRTVDSHADAGPVAGRRGPVPRDDARRPRRDRRPD